MKKLLFLLLLASLKMLSQTYSAVGASNLIPLPSSCIEGSGTFALSENTLVNSPVEFSDVANLLRDEMGLKSPDDHIEATISLVKKESIANPEGYELTITPSNITLASSTVNGAIRGVFSLLQLQKIQPDQQLIPCANIIDSPRFAYRGMHLDVSRNFFPTSFIKKFIDMLAIYKFNTFHWHLTDSPGWRLQIAKYPLLTSVGAFRTHRTWKEWGKNGSKFSQEGLPNAYGGYYTAAQAKEIVAYAAQRGITVIPEIEMPGHAYEVTAAYPELSCTGVPYVHHEVCIGNPKTLTFFKDVLTDVIDIFPSTYIHVGGDEAGTDSWKKCPKCQALKELNNLENEHQVQAYLIKEIELFLKSKGRKLIGWDEIIEGGLPPDATVMDWRGNAKTAIEQGHDVVLSNGQCYLDFYQSDPTTQPEAIGGFLPIQKVYAYEPVPASLKPEQEKHVLGLQGNIWTEFMPTTYQVEYMGFPRAIAIAETGWTKKADKNFSNFHKRLQQHYLLMQRMNLNYYRPSTFITISEKPTESGKANEVSFVSEQYNPEIRYTTDGSLPNDKSEIYTKPFNIKGKTVVTAAVFKGYEMLGKPTTYTANHHKAIGKKVTFNTMYDADRYPAQREQTLTNGIRGSITYQDAQWLGYLNDFDVTLDMEKEHSIKELSVRFMHQKGPGVFLPAYVEILFSNDGTNFTSVKKLTSDIPADADGVLFNKYKTTFNGEKARYIKLVAPNIHGGYMFVDEIVVY